MRQKGYISFKSEVAIPEAFDGASGIGLVFRPDDLMDDFLR
jgi:hypothetical protein